MNKRKDACALQSHEHERVCARGTLTTHTQTHPHRRTHTRHLSREASGADLPAAERAAVISFFFFSKCLGRRLGTRFLSAERPLLARGKARTSRTTIFTSPERLPQAGWLRTRAGYVQNGVLIIRVHALDVFLFVFKGRQDSRNEVSTAPVALKWDAYTYTRRDGAENGRHMHWR